MVINATSKSEATGAALESAKSLWPPDQYWTGHSVVVSEPIFNQEADDAS